MILLQFKRDASRPVISDRWHAALRTGVPAKAQKRFLQAERLWIDLRDDFDELWVLLRCATRRGSQNAGFVEQLAGYFFERVTESEARDVVLDKLREFDLVPKDELDPQKLRDAFIVKVARYVDLFAGGATLLFTVAFVAFNYALFTFGGAVTRLAVREWRRGADPGL